jgi:hypothetical protein
MWDIAEYLDVAKKICMRGEIIQDFGTEICCAVFKKLLFFL